MVPNNMQQYISAYMSQLLKTAPEPTPMTPGRVHEMRTRCNELNGFLANLEATRSHVPSERWPEIHKRSIMARAHLTLIYFQLFRINDLPTEILNIIFRHVVWSSTSPDVGILTRLRITWVCKRWREVAIGDSTLWSAIWFRDVPPNPRSFCWFGRAGATTLDIRVSEPRESAWTGPQMEELLDKILTKDEQIRSIVISVDNWPPALVVLDKLSAFSQKRNFPLLERFELHRNGSPYVWIGAGYEPDRHRNPMLLFGGAQLPSLKHITINGIHIDWMQSCLSNLSRLDLRRIPLEMSPTLSRFRDILRSCPTLNKLSLDGAGPAWTPLATDDPPITHTRLKHLVIGDYSLQYAIYVMHQLRAPNLRELTLMNLIGEDYAPFFSMITGSFPEVRVLTTYNIECGPTPASKAIMLKWLHSMPKIGFLRLANLRLPFIQLFLCNSPPLAANDSSTQEQSSGPPQVIAPNLLYLDVTANDPGVVVHLVVCRKTMGLPFRKVFIDHTLSTKFTSEQTAKILEASKVYLMPAPLQTEEELEVLAS